MTSFCATCLQSCFLFKMNTYAILLAIIEILCHSLFHSSARPLGLVAPLRNTRDMLSGKASEKESEQYREYISETPLSNKTGSHTASLSDQSNYVNKDTKADGNFSINLIYVTYVYRQALLRNPQSGTLKSPKAKIKNQLMPLRQRRTLRAQGLERREVLSVVPVQTLDDCGNSGMITVPVATVITIVSGMILLLLLQRLCCSCVRTDDGFKWRFIVCCEDIMEGLLYDGLIETCLNIIWCNVGLEQNVDASKSSNSTSTKKFKNPFTKKKKKKKGNKSANSSRTNSFADERTAIVKACSNANASPSYSHRDRSSRVPLIAKPPPVVLIEREEEKDAVTQTVIGEKDGDDGEAVATR